MALLAREHSHLRILVWAEREHRTQLPDHQHAAQLEASAFEALCMTEETLSRLKKQIMVQRGGPFVAITPQLAVLLLECLQGLYSIHPTQGVWKTPNDELAAYIDSALARLDGAV
jgi:hypothetical protein